MKKLVILLFTMFSVAFIYAQNERTEAEIFRSQFKLEKKKIVADYMMLGNESAGKFWPLYDQYEQERSKLGDRKIKLLENYINNHQSKSIKDADGMVKESADIQKKEVALREKYYGLISKSIDTKTGLDFFEVEDMIATKVRMELWSALK
jgi:hypothetical protein